MSAILRLVMALWMLHPAGFQPPQDVAQERIRRARTVLASTVDSSLPAVPLDEWVRQIVGSSARYQWASGFCEGAAASTSPDLPVCGVVVAAAPDVVITVSIRLGERSPGAQTDRWETPRFDDGFMDRGKDSLTLDRLSDLPRMLTVPPQRWPKREVDLEKDAVQCSPLDPMLGETVTCRAVVSNPGAAAAHARLFVEVQPVPELGGETVIRIPARTRKTVTSSLVWPHRQGGSVSIGVELNSRTTYNRVNGRGELVLRQRSDIDERALDESPDGELETILMTRGAVGETPRSFDVPVDGSVRRLVMSVELDPGLDATVRRPGGLPVNQSDPDVRVGSVKRVEVARPSVTTQRVYTVTTPKPGVWRVEISGTGQSGSRRFALIARGNSPIAFGNFEFVRKQEGVHRGYFPINGMPLAAAPAIGRAQLWNGPASGAFRTIDELGITLQTLALRNDDPDSTPDSHVGTLPLPAVPFSIVMNGTDAAGAAIQRQFPVLFRAQTVSVFFNFDGPDVIVAGSSRQLRFTVTNLGAATATFTLHARTSLGEVRDPSPRTVSLGPGASATPTFSLAIPADASRGDSIDVRLTATNTADAAQANSDSATLRVAHDEDRDRDSVKDDVDAAPAAPLVVRRVSRR